MAESSVGELAGASGIGGVVVWLVQRMLNGPNDLAKIDARLRVVEEAIGPNGLRAVIDEWRKETRELRDAVTSLREAVAEIRGAQ